jgi:hypothetical protein
MLDVSNAIITESLLPPFELGEDGMLQDSAYRLEAFKPQHVE